MKWHVLGSASGLTVPNRFHSAYFLEHKGRFLLVDCGDGTAHALARQPKPNLDFEAVLISHTHPDHAAGLPLLLQYLMMRKRKSPLDIFVPAFYKEFLLQQLAYFYIFPEKWPFPLHIHALEKRLNFWDELQVDLFPTQHLKGVESLARAHGVGTESYGFHFSVGKRSLIFTSDIRSVDAISRYIETADWLFIEGAHASVAEICQLAVDKGIRHVRITHIPPDLEAEENTLGALAEKFGVEDLKLATDGEIVAW